MQHGRWLGIAAAGVFSVAAAPVAAAAPALTSGGVALHVHGATSGNWSGYADIAEVHVRWKFAGVVGRLGGARWLR
jgi:hypothetical protein